MAAKVGEKISHRPVVLVDSWCSKKVLYVPNAYVTDGLISITSDHRYASNSVLSHKFKCLKHRLVLVYLHIGA